MSRVESNKAGRRARRQFSEEFKAGAVRLVIEEDKTVGAVAQNLDAAVRYEQTRAAREQGQWVLAIGGAVDTLPVVRWALDGRVPARHQRLAAYVLVRRGEDVLLSRVSARGHEPGSWTLPGGPPPRDDPRAASAGTARSGRAHRIVASRAGSRRGTA